MVVINERIKEVKSATAQRFHAVWQNNFNANKQAISRNQGIRPLRGKFKDIPVILIGAGPSLDRNIEFLHIAADKSILLLSGSRFPTGRSAKYKQDGTAIRNDVDCEFNRHYRYPGYDPDCKSYCLKD